MSGDVRYPGWCCRQIAAQLSQALFTMADLHAQVSDLREENRQLKIKIENIDIRRSVEDMSSAKGLDSPVASSCISSVPPNSTCVEKNIGTKTNHPHPQDVLKQVLNLQNPVKEPCDSNLALLSEIKQERLVLNVPFKHISDEEKGEPSQATSPQISGDFKCDKCNHSFPNAALLMTHQAVHFGRSFHICKVCNAMFLLKADLYRHWATHPNIKQHICQLCGKAYTSKNNYKLHIKTHTGEGLYPCEVCGKAFHSENHLNVHRRIHTGERPYECQFCDKSFTQKSGLINHTRLHTGEKPFLCPSCPKAFTQKSNLNFHLSKHHPVSGNVLT